MNLEQGRPELGAAAEAATPAETGLTPSVVVHSAHTYGRRPCARTPSPIPYNSARQSAQIRGWASPCSFATTEGISVDFFSSA